MSEVDERVNAVFDVFRIIANPRYWSMNYSYSKQHDETLNKVLDENHTPVEFTRFTIKLGDTCVWIANWPYAVGINHLHTQSRPSRRTIMRLGSYLNSHGIRL